MIGLELLTDFYELTMMQGYFYNSPHKEVVFDYFIRKNPFEGGYTVFTGLTPLLEELEKLSFSENSIDYLYKTGLFQKEFLGYLRNFQFKCDIYAAKEGEIIFPNEPVLIVSGSIIEAQLIESILLNTLNFQSLIATKTSRIIQSAKNKPILEFGLRRAQGVDGSISGTRAAYIGGCSATSNTLAGKKYDIPVKGTMAHSWIMSFHSESEAFEKYAELYPNNCTLLVDTYDTLKSGMPNAIITLKKLQKNGYKNFGIRLDSGNLDELSNAVRKVLDKNDLREAKIVVSSDLDETIIDELVSKHCPIDIFGVGTKLITGCSDSSLTGVYKLAAIKNGSDDSIPVLKVSNNLEKRTNPGFKNIMRFYNANDKMMLDLIYLKSEEKKLLENIKSNKNISLFNQNCELFNFSLKNHSHVEIILKQAMSNGKILDRYVSLEEIKKYKSKQINRLNANMKNLIIHEEYPVVLSENLSKLKQKLVNWNNQSVKL